MVTRHIFDTSCVKHMSMGIVIISATTPCLNSLLLRCSFYFGSYFVVEHNIHSFCCYLFNYWHALFLQNLMRCSVILPCSACHMLIRPSYSSFSQCLLLSTLPSGNLDLESRFLCFHTCNDRHNFCFVSLL